MNKKNVFLWTLYDFANSIAIIVFFLYFSQWLVIDKGLPDFWYNMLFTLGSLMLLATTPVFGSMADKTGEHRRYLNWSTALFATLLFATTLITLFWSGEVYLAALTFLLANYFYQFSFTFYNALLYHIAPPEKWGRISGLGQAGNWLGQMTGLLVTLPFAVGTVYLVGEAGKVQAFLPAVIVFVVLALPMLLFFKVPVVMREKPKSFLQEYKEQWRNFKSLWAVPGMAAFLLAYFFFNDAILTATNNFPIYLEKVLNINDQAKSFLMLGILFTSAVGALSGGWLADKLGLKRTLVGVLVAWCVTFPVLALTTNVPLFVAETIVMGLLFGATWTVTRATMTALCPPAKLNYGFSFYTLFERMSSFVGPFFYGLMTSFVALGATRYRLALGLLPIFIVIGIYFVRKINLRSTSAPAVEQALMNP